MITGPKAPLIAFYGDDFTGSTDVMEALTMAGVDTVLFLGPPTSEDLARFPSARGIGVAGVARTMSPEQMDAQLPMIFRSLRATGAPLFHYKICSTFDSSPEIGSIGRGLDIARREFETDMVPMVVGAPALRRYQVFGNLYAAVDGVTHRLDRHPTMTRHPITPMGEADIRLHLARQTSATIALIDRLTLAEGPAAVDRHIGAEESENADVILFDVLDDSDLIEIGRVISRAAETSAATVVAVGSSGVEYALDAHWRAHPPAEHTPFTPVYAPRRQTLAVSGSRAPASDAQVAYALHNGFASVFADPSALTGSSSGVDELVARALAVLETGADAVVHTPPKADRAVDADRLGLALGEATRRIVHGAGIRRLVVAGGDTSGRVARALEIIALRMIAPAAPGAPLCRATSEVPLIDGLEIALKGGQVGPPDYFVSIARLDGDEDVTITTPKS